jgi:large subunit ribosomal protein L9
MEVILLERVQNLGDLGDLVKVRPGYARNYLIPLGKATAATAENKARFEQHRLELQKAAEDKLTRARARAEQMTGVTVTIARKAGEEGRLFGSVGPADISEAVKALGFDLARSEIHLSEGPLKVIGTHAVSVSLHPEVHFKISVDVVVEEEPTA